MKKLTYGNGRLQTQQGTTADGNKCLTIKEIEEAKPVGSTPKEWKEKTEEKDYAVILEFKTLEGARVLQDELNALLSQWSLDEAEVI